ncbi:MAG: hypothetical protein A2527_07590 [Candidatus Lambdaproteobacteria bacterium RIFOXYD2_FULL_50_16]|uniref:Cytochrome c domain-containing protein n=1 Tax=Candidatus Lambdaproteobacteria bacterium RIFOXYD2_FULL_50_16 TaxID=1817772 RepID=A0A1F6GB83_9PROT|nr:MAG: hypothetical protein A2527_07590 [Candidatus Lambdaproteobacteria bacterium RIFOXYD2_FULL_50_16]
MKKVLGIILGVSLLFAAAPAYAGDFGQCAGCHGPSAGGASGPKLVGFDKAYLTGKALEIMAGTRVATTPTGKSLIPVMAGTMKRLNNNNAAEIVAGSGLDKALDFVVAQH